MVAKSFERGVPLGLSMMPRREVSEIRRVEGLSGPPLGDL